MYVELKVIGTTLSEMDDVLKLTSFHYHKHITVRSDQNILNNPHDQPSRFITCQCL
mgnify:CR=1